MCQVKPQRVEVPKEQVDQLLAEGKEVLRPVLYETLEDIVKTLATLTELLKQKDVTVRKLQDMLFGSKTETLENVLGQESGSKEQQVEPEPAATQSPEDTEPAEKPKPKRKGHGRNGVDEYSGAKKLESKHETLQPGHPCPDPDCRGKVYAYGPRRIINLTGQAPVQATIWEIEQLRCNLCLKIFSAPIPPEAKPEKYDAKAASMIALLRYGAGVPFWRLQGLQKSFGIPLPSSTQWDLVREAAEKLMPAYEELIRQAAQGDVLYNDDTNMKILSMMKKDKEKQRDAG